MGVHQRDVSNIDAITGMSAMEGINQVSTNVVEVNLTITKIGQDTSNFYTGLNSHGPEQKEYFEPLTGAGFETNMCTKTPQGISRFHCTQSLAGGPHKRGVNAAQ